MMERKDPARRVTDMDRWIGKRLCAMRVACGIKPEDLADICGISKQQLHKYETGKNRIPAGRLIDITVHVFKLPLDYFNPTSSLGYKMPDGHGIGSDMDMESGMAQAAQEQETFGKGDDGSSME